MSKINDAVTGIKTKPNKVTFHILVLGGAVVAALWFLVLGPAQRDLTNATEELNEAQATNAALSDEISSFRAGESFTSAQIGPAVAPAEALLPSAGSPGTTANRIRDLALGSGLSVGNVSFPNAYTPDGPAKLRADVQMQVAGPIAGLTAWLDSLSEFEQLVTVTTSGPSMSDSDGTATMEVKVTVWASSLESWADGLPNR